MKTKNPLRFCVYAYLREHDSKTGLKGTVYYIGKGDEKRPYANHGKTPKPKNKTNIIIMENNLSEIGAFALERRYIGWYGRKDLGTGILINLTDGGEGVTGRRYVSTQKRNMAISRGHMGKKLTPEHIEKSRKARTGMKRSIEYCKSSSVRKLGVKQSLVTCNHCGKIGGNATMPRWHFDNCKHKLPQNPINH
jgi:hypothetical protein